WLECEEICVPGQGDSQLKLKVGVEARADNSLAKGFDEARDKLPASGLKPLLRAEQRGEKLYLIGARGSLQKKLLFFPYEEGVITNSGEQTLVSEKGSQQLLIPLETSTTSLSRIIGVLVGDPGWGDPL